MQFNGQILVTFNKARLNTFGFADNFYKPETLHDFFPDRLQLHFCKAIAHASMQAESERHVVP